MILQISPDNRILIQPPGKESTSYPGRPFHPSITEGGHPMRGLLGTIAVLTISGLCWAQTTENSPTPQPAEKGQQQTAPHPAGQTGALRIAPGSVIPVQLTKTVDAKKVKTGDQVVAKVTMDLKTQSGQVLVPKDTEVLGHVTEAPARSKQEKESQLGIAFDHAVLKDGGNVNLPMSIQAVIGPQNSGNNAETAPPPSSQQPGGMSPSAGGRSMGPGNAAPGNGAPTNEPPADNGSADTSSNNQRPPITANTRGVVGFSNLRLDNPSNAKQGSVLSSDKNNVKLESGTLMLLRVSQ